MLLAGLIVIAVALSVAMFATRNSMLGFPSGLFWALVGGQAYTQSDVAWDIYFMLAFASLLGMTTFCMLGAFALREKRDTIGEQELEEGDGGYIDEGEGKSDLEFHSGEETSHPSKRTQALRKRASGRRTRL